MTGTQPSGYGGAAATPHHLATATAARLLAEGANAVDAAVAANAVLGVVAPETCGIGGDLFALVHQPGSTAPDCLNASGRAGSGADAAAMRDQGLDEIPYTHPASVTVPGCVDGWEALLDRHGTRDLPYLLSPAIGYAEEGFAASLELASALERRLDDLRDEASAAALLPEGRPPPVGTSLRRPDLARTLRQIADGGRGAFYKGSAGEAISNATGGLLTPEDLAPPHADWVEPLGLELHGLSAWTVPPNSPGYLTLAATWLFEQLHPPGDFDDPAFTHLLVEAFRAVNWERADVVTDPDRAPWPPEHLVDRTRLMGRLEHIREDRRATWPASAVALGGTAFLCVADSSGLGISLIQSNFTGLGSCIGAGEAGFLLHNRGAGFNLTDGHPNELKAGSRPQHTLSPTAWTKDGRLRLLLGTRGGFYQPQLLIQSIAQLFRLGREPAAAQAAPRWMLDTADILHVEDGMPPSVIEGLRARGHQVAIEAPLQGGWGPISMIAVDDEGLRTAAADPRVATAQAVVS